MPIDNYPTPRKAGRPQGSITAPRPIVDAQLTRCPKCHSTERQPYVGTPTQQRISGVHDGWPFNVIVYRRTRCLVCGQARIDREFLAEPQPL